jgi:16S rRNA (cytosine1402-N4)-methyltransferase
MSHVPVLLQEVVDNLNAKKGGRFVDATVGGGGHLAAILEANPKNEVVGIDLDRSALEKSVERAKLVFGNYKDIDEILSDVGWEKVDGILLDLGFSSLQLDKSDRGFSFSADGPLDMRYDQNSSLTAKKIVNQYSPKDLERVISELGEERLSRKIVTKIINARKVASIETTEQLSSIVRSAVPLPIRFKANDNIRRVFQAIRIEVNSELENLKTALPKMLKLLSPGGRLAVISFHSLEDRIVKEFFVSESKGCICPPEFPTCVCDKASTLRIITRKPIIASDEEMQTNPRSKSAKLRVGEKT